MVTGVLAADPAAARPLRADAARNRVLILNAATEVFSERGLEAGVEEVAHRAGVGMGTLYRRFPTKEALVDELARHLLQGIEASAGAALDRADGSSVATFLSLAGAQFASHGGLLKRLWCVPAPVEEILALRARFAALIAADQAAGTLRAEIVASDISVVLWSLQGIVETAGNDAMPAIRRHVEVVLAGMGTGVTSFTAPPLSAAELDRIHARRTQP